MFLTVYTINLLTILLHTQLATGASYFLGVLIANFHYSFLNDHEGGAQ